MEAPLSTCLIHSGTLVCMDPASTVTRGDLLVRDTQIAALGEAVPAALSELPGGKADEEIDATNSLVLPGFIHGHIHLCQTLFRGLAEQSDLLRWLRESIWPLEAAHTESSIAASTRVGLCELLASGITCLNDMGTVRHTDVIAAVLGESGVRAVFGKALMDQGEGAPAAMIEPTDRAMAEALAIADRHDGTADGRLRVSLAPRFILSCSEALWHDVTAAAAERDLMIHTHIAEAPSERRAVEAAVHDSAARYFADKKVLSGRFVGAHGVWLEPDELDLLKRADAALVHCPGSNLKLGSGYADVRAWADAGIRRGIGSDGAACNNRLDVFHEMSVAAGLSRVKHPDHPPSAREVLALATCDGAAALGLGDRIGSLEAGKQADVLVLDASAPHQAPNAERDPYLTVVHSSRPSDVRVTMVAGRVLYEDGAWTTIDPERAIADANAEALGLARRMEAAQ